VTAEPFTVASFNTLGAAHTGRHGNKPWMASGEVRTLRMASVLRRHAVDLVGLQEFEAPQAAVFRRHAAAAYAFWHPRGRSANTIAWRRDRFALVRATTERVHYFEGRVQPMPVVLLRDLRSPGVELWVVNVHNPAGTRNHPRQQHWRTLDMAAERAVVRRLLATGRPVLLTGDMNEKAEAFCAFTSNGPLHAAAGAARGDGRCRPPANARIDWIFGSARVRFTDYRVDRSALVRRTTDHSVVLARARVVPPGS
jgi:endonuclease/exonuclease/phosphatase family metal-dependent hydrolase